MHFRSTPAAIIVGAALIATPALASGDDMTGGPSNGMGSVGMPGAGGMSVGAIADYFTQMGYTVRSVEAEDGGYEVKAIDPNGMRVETHVDSQTGQFRHHGHHD